MSHFNFENAMNSVLKMDAPMTKGPQMRWQRKLNDSCSTSKNESQLMINSSLNVSAVQSAKTPIKNMNTSGLTYSKTPGKTPSKTPSKTPAKGSLTPGRGNKTPVAGDRFIPNRSATHFELGHYLMSSQKTAEELEMDETMSPSKREQQLAMNENLNGEALGSKIMAYQNKPPTAPEGHQNNLKVLYSANKLVGSVRKSTRHIPQVPERILDAPEILDDYYLNLLDWSANNHLAVSLGPNVYLWDATSGDIHQLMELENPEEYVTSVSWVKEGNFLAVGTSNCDVQLWDVEKRKKIRSMTGHAARISSLAWNSYILCSGSRSGYIHQHDVRAAQHQVSILGGHTQEVCGLQWSPDGHYLASGANDNLLNVWGTVQGGLSCAEQPLYTFSQHQAAVKAVAWCPWQPGLLASGGGTADRHIRFWNCNTGSLLNSVDTKSQVCGLLWSKDYREIISGHGFVDNQLIIWKYPTMTKVAELTGHTSRVLHMCMSPDGTTVVSAAADETLRLWKCFATDPSKKKTADKPSSSSVLSRPGIR